MEKEALEWYIYIATGFLIFFCYAHFVHGQETELKSEGKSDSLYFISESLFKCNIKLPENYNPNQTHKLAIGLHGGGSTPELS